MIAYAITVSSGPWFIPAFSRLNSRGTHVVSTHRKLSLNRSLTLGLSAVQARDTAPDQEPATPTRAMAVGNLEVLLSTN